MVKYPKKTTCSRGKHFKQIIENVHPADAVNDDREV